MDWDFGCGQGSSGQSSMSRSPLDLPSSPAVQDRGSGATVCPGLEYMYRKYFAGSDLPPA